MGMGVTTVEKSGTLKVKGQEQRRRKTEIEGTRRRDKLEEIMGSRNKVEKGERRTTN